MGAHTHGGSVGLVETNDDGTKSSTIEATYTALIQQYLALLCVDNATFLAERYVASCKSNHSYYMLAICHYRAGSPQRAVAVLEQAKHQGSFDTDARYLLAKCYFELEKYGQAEDSLLKHARATFRKSNLDDMDEWILSATPCPVPNGAAGLNLMGEICKRSNRKEKAMHYFRLSLKLDPIMWTSYEALCEMGCDLMEPTEIFGVVPAALTVKQEPSKGHEQVATPVDETQERGVLTPSFTLSQQSPAPAETPMSRSALFSARLPKTTHSNTTGAKSSVKGTPQFETPNLTPILMNEKSMMTNPQIVGRARKVAARLYYPPSPELATPGSSFSDKRPRSLFLSGIDKRVSFSTTVPEDSALLASTPGQAHSSLFLPTTTATKPPKPETSFGVPPHPTSTDSGAPPSFDSSAETVVRKGGSEEEEGVREILELLCVMGAAHRRLCQFQCKEALRIFQQLSREQFNTGWVLHQIGRAYFEMADYQNAQRHLELMQEVEPHRMKGLEVLSTTLWHLKKEVELAHLAQRAVDFDRKSAECWCVVGNCFSLQKEHETALTFFRRSIQLDPSFTYSHTLSGHEYAAIEDFDKAVSCYRDAIRADERHYNAWYGLGALYYRQEKYDLAEYHFQKALTINTQSSVLYCHLGMAQHSNGKAYQALDTLAGAFRLDPRNPQARYQRATIYMAMDRPHEALVELEKVRDAAPREATIHFAMGRVLKRIGRQEQAMRCFLIALDLDPKDANVIKAAMEKLDEPDVDEEVSAF